MLKLRTRTAKFGDKLSRLDRNEELSESGRKKHGIEPLKITLIKLNNYEKLEVIFKNPPKNDSRKNSDTQRHEVMTYLA